MLREISEDNPPPSSRARVFYCRMAAPLIFLTLGVGAWQMNAQITDGTISAKEYSGPLSADQVEAKIRHLNSVWKIREGIVHEILIRGFSMANRPPGTSSIEENEIFQRKNFKAVTREYLRPEDLKDKVLKAFLRDVEDIPIFLLKDGRDKKPSFSNLRGWALIGGIITGALAYGIGSHLPASFPWSMTADSGSPLAMVLDLPGLSHPGWVALATGAAAASWIFGLNAQIPDKEPRSVHRLPERPTGHLNVSAWYRVWQTRMLQVVGQMATSGPKPKGPLIWIRSTSVFITVFSEAARKVRDALLDEKLSSERRLYWESRLANLTLVPEFFDALERVPSGLQPLRIVFASQDATEEKVFENHGVEMNRIGADYHSHEGKEALHLDLASLPDDLTWFNGTRLPLTAAFSNSPIERVILLDYSIYLYEVKDYLDYHFGRETPAILNRDWSAKKEPSDGQFGRLAAILQNEYEIHAPSLVRYVDAINEGFPWVTPIPVSDIDAIDTANRLLIYAARLLAPNHVSSEVLAAARILCDGASRLIALIPEHSPYASNRQKLAERLKMETDQIHRLEMPPESGAAPSVHKPATLAKIFAFAGAAFGAARRFWRRRNSIHVQPSTQTSLGPVVATPDATKPPAERATPASSVLRDEKTGGRVVPGSGGPSNHPRSIGTWGAMAGIFLAAASGNLMAGAVRLDLLTLLGVQIVVHEILGHGVFAQWSEGKWKSILLNALCLRGSAPKFSASFPRWVAYLTAPMASLAAGVLVQAIFEQKGYIGFDNPGIWLFIACVIDMLPIPGSDFWKAIWSQNREPSSPLLRRLAPERRLIALAALGWLGGALAVALFAPFDPHVFLRVSGMLSAVTNVTVVVSAILLLTGKWFWKKLSVLSAAVVAVIGASQLSWLTGFSAGIIVDPEADPRVGTRELLETSRELMLCWQLVALAGAVFLVWTVVPQLRADRLRRQQKRLEEELIEIDEDALESESAQRALSSVEAFIHASDVRKKILLRRQAIRHLDEACFNQESRDAHETVDLLNMLDVLDRKQAHENFKALNRRRETLGPEWDATESVPTALSGILMAGTLALGALILYYVLTILWGVVPAWASVKAGISVVAARQVWTSLLPRRPSDFRPMRALRWTLAIGLTLFFGQIAAGILWLLKVIDSRSLRSAAGAESLFAGAPIFLFIKPARGMTRLKEAA